MSKSPRSAAAEQSRERVVFVDILKQQMLDLKAWRKKVAEAESASAAAAKKKRKQTPLFPHPRRAVARGRPPAWSRSS